MTQDGSDLTPDALLRRNAARHPDRDALCDPPDRQAFCGDAPRRLTWREATAEVEAIAGVLRHSGLPQGSVIGIQLPNVVESVLAPLAVLRAGMVPALMPLLWRQSDCVLGLARAHAKALIVCGRVGGCDHGALALDVAAELFPIRVLFGFGQGLPDGIVRLPDALSAASPCEHETSVPPGVVTFDVGAEGPVSCPRSCGELLAAGLLVKERAGIEEGSVALSTLSIASFAGLAGILLPWLLTGGTLALHHPFDPEVLGDQMRRHRPSLLVVPDTILPALRDSMLCEANSPAAILSVARAPERMRHAPPWPHHIRLVDVAAFGEVALLAQERAPDGRFAGWRAGPVLVGAGDAAMEIARIAATPQGTLAVRGPLAAAPPPDAYAPAPLRAGDDGFVDTRHPCAPGDDRDHLIVTAGPPGLARVGGYAFAIDALQDGIREHEHAALLAALPHALCGQRLAGHGAEPAAIQRGLLAQGANPLLAQAFSAREATAR